MTILNSIIQHFEKAEVLVYGLLSPLGSEGPIEQYDQCVGERSAFATIFVVPDKVLAHRMPARQSRFNQRISEQL